MRIALAILMALHGVAHLVGFAGAWSLAPEGVPYKTTVLAGHVDLGDVGIRAVGLLWLATAAAFLFAGLAAVRGTAWWPQLALGVAAVSLLLSATEWPEARIGVAINALIITALIAARWLGRLWAA